MSAPATGVWASGPLLAECGEILLAARQRGLVGDADTAVIVHDLDLVGARVRSLVDLFPSSALHAIAIKANPVVGVLRTVVENGGGLEAASIEEVHLALAAGCDPSAIVFDSPAKTHAEIRESLERGVTLNANSFDELDRIAELRPESSSSTVGLRVDPMVGKGRIGTTSVSGADSKFGVPLPQARERLPDWCRQAPWFGAVHSHVGSQGCSLDQLVEAARRIANLRTELHDELGRAQIDTVDLGGGLPTTYSDADPFIDMGTYVDALVDAAPSLFGDDVRLITEFGRCVHAHAGWAASDVEYVDRRADQARAVVHLGADFLLRPVYRPEAWGHRFGALDSDAQPKPGAPQSTRVFGPLCFGGDVIATDVELPVLDPDDTVVIHDVGAYTLSMWSRHCSRGIPLVLGSRRTASGELDISVLRPAERPADIVTFWGG